MRIKEKKEYNINDEGEWVNRRKTVRQIRQIRPTQNEKKNTKQIPRHPPSFSYTSYMPPLAFSTLSAHPRSADAGLALAAAAFEPGVSRAPVVVAAASGARLPVVHAPHVATATGALAVPPVDAAGGPDFDPGASALPRTLPRRAPILQSAGFESDSDFDSDFGSGSSDPGSALRSHDLDPAPTHRPSIPEPVVGFGDERAHDLTCATAAFALRGSAASMSASGSGIGSRRGGAVDRVAAAAAIGHAEARK